MINNTNINKQDLFIFNMAIDWTDSPGCYVRKTNGTYEIWDRYSRRFVETHMKTQSKVGLGLRHLRDVCHIAKKHGLKRATSYDWGLTKELWKTRLVKGIEIIANLFATPNGHDERHLSKTL